MLQAIRGNPKRQASASVHSIPAPVGGLNARDALSAMKPTDAIVLENFFPEANYVVLRKGFAGHNFSGSGSDIQSLMTYHATDGDEQLFAAAGGTIVDVTSKDLASIVYSTGITNNKWQYVNFSTAGGLFIVAVNGTDTPLKYDGSNWDTDSITGSVPSSANLINVWSHKERLWFAEKDTLNAYYLPSNAVTGAVVKFPLGGVFNNGGQLLAGGTLSTDSGSGIDDLIVFVTDNGEVAIYAGTNPSSPTDWSLLGVYPIGLAVGHRCLFKVAGDLIVITTFGAESIKQVMSSDRAEMDKRTITGKIRETFNAQVQNYRSNFGWQGFVYAKGRYAIINVPIAEGVRQEQYIQNLNTGAWCKFTGQRANCWATLNDELYFGGNAIDAEGSSAVFKADTGHDDNGHQLHGEIKTAFNACGTSGQNKFFNELRPLLLTNGTASLTAGVNVDYNNSVPTGTLSASAGDTGLWGSARWGSSRWGGRGLLVRNWLTIGQIGTTVAARLRVAASGITVQLNGFDINYQKSQGQIF